MKLSTLLFALLLFALLLLAPLSQAKDVTGYLTVDSRQRTYLLHVPPSYSADHPAPLFLSLHGRLGDGKGQARLSHFDSLSDQHGFLVVYPDGLNRSWADGRNATPSDKQHVNDVHFLSELITRLQSEYNIDPNRIYANGMSNGGFMTARLACDLSDRLAAVAIVAASISVPTANSCHPARPISVLIIQGTADPLVPFDGGALGRNGDRGEILSHQATVEKFAALDHCPNTPKTQHIPDTANDKTSVDVSLFTACSAGTEVASYEVVNGGHAWPGGLAYLPASAIGITSHNLDASSTIYSFFLAHPR